MKTMAQEHYLLNIGHGKNGTTLLFNDEYPDGITVRIEKENSCTGRTLFQKYKEQGVTQAMAYDAVKLSLELDASQYDRLVDEGKKAEDVYRESKVSSI